MDIVRVFGQNLKKYRTLKGFSQEKFELLSQLRRFNYQRIYDNAQMRQRKETIARCIGELFDYFTNLFAHYNFDYPAYEKEGRQTALLFAKYMESMQRVYHNDPKNITQIIADYIAGMTDSFALNVMEEVILPNSIKFLR